ncbi:MAG: LemA family protein [Phormidesmis sp.]
MTPYNAIPEDSVPIVLERAARLYQQQQQENTYSLEQLTAAGSEAQIPPEFMQQAYQQLQQEQAAQVQQQQQRQRNLKVGGAIAATSVLMLALWTGKTYNSLNAAEATVSGQWAQVENQMQRRADLILPLTQVAESFADRESAVIESMNAARSSFLTATTVAERSAADIEVRSAIANFQTFAANSQQLQSNQLFINLQYEIAGTENRIATERMRYNQAVESYNRSIESFPTVLISGALGFKPQSFLEKTK